MGMYDTIVCKYPIPLPTDPMGYVNSESFQTKDLENSLSHYEIREDGTLWEQKHETKWIDGDPNSKNWLDRLGRSESIGSWWDQLSFTNTIRLFDYQHHDDVDYDYLIEYKIVFVKGIVSEVTMSHFESRPNTERKRNDREFIQRMKQDKDFVQSKRYRYFYKHYKRTIRFIFNGLIKLFNWLTITVIKFERWLT